MSPYDLAGLGAGLLVAVAVWRRPAILDRPWPLAIFWVVALNLPFWMLGPASLVSGGDEIARSLPSLLQQQHLHGYGWGPSGGLEPQLVALGPPAATLSLESFLIGHLPLWIAQLVQKLVVTAVGFAGGFLIGRKVSGNLRIAVICGLWATLPDYGFVLTWHVGCSMAGMPLAAYVIGGRLGARRYWGPVALLALAWPLSNLPIHLMPAFVVSWAAVALVIGAPLRLWRFVGASALVASALAVNWAQALFGVAQMASGMDRDLSKSPADILHYLLFITGKLPINLGVTLASLAVLLLLDRRAHAAKAGVVAVVVVLGPLLQLVPYSRLGLGVLDGFHFTYVLFALLAVAPVLLAQALTGLSRRAPRLVPVLAVAAVAAIAVAMDTENTVSEIGVTGLRGSMAAMALDPARFAGYRAITVPVGVTPAMTAAAGVDTLDGGGVTLSGRLRAFWDMGVKGLPNTSEALHGYVEMEMPRNYQGPEPYSLGACCSLAMLRLANVGFVVSRVPMADAGLTLVQRPDRPDPSWDGLDKMGRVKARLRDLLTPPPLYVYRLPGAAPRVFLAANAVRSRFDYQQPEFYRQLRGTAAGTVLIDTDAAAPPAVDACCGSGELAATTVDGRHIEARVGHLDKPGLLVVNATWTPFHHAEIDHRAAATFPVDGFQIGVMVPAGDHTVTIAYDRPGPWSFIESRLRGAAIVEHRALTAAPPAP